MPSARKFTFNEAEVKVAAVVRAKAVEEVVEETAEEAAEMVTEKVAEVEVCVAFGGSASCNACN